jgi:protein CpxP
MKKYSTFFLLVSILLIVLSACSDTPEPRGRFSPEERVAQLSEDLELSPEQAEQIKQILTEQQEKFAELRGNFTGDRSEMRAAMREVREEFDKKIKEVLNDDQKRKYDQIQAERRQRFQRSREREE